MTSPVFLPPPVRPGDRVGVAALSGPVDPARLERGLAALAGYGFEVVPAGNLGARTGYLAGDDAQRLDAFHELVADPTLSAIFFARGGYGVTRLIERLDWELLARHPRAYVGYSDLTPFLDQVVRRLGLAAFHGPMVAADLARGLSGDEERSWLAALAGELPSTLELSTWLAEGEAEGPLRGGCLSLVAASIGTSYALDLDGAIVFLEDLNEPLYRLDRLLTQLLASGTLAGANGIVVGHVDLVPGETPERWLDLLSDRLGNLGIPVALGVPAGHSPPNWTLPLGARAQLAPGEPLKVGIS